MGDKSTFKQLREDEREVRKQLIIKAAKELFEEKSFHEIGMRDIAIKAGVSAASIYRYFPSRDDLVTALIVDAFRSLAESQQDSINILPESDFSARLSTLGLAYRAWAITYPQRYHLIFGTPIPGYEAPADITVPAAAWSLMPLIETLASIRAAGKLRVASSVPLTPAL